MSGLVVLLMMLTVFGAVGAVVCRFCPDVLVGLFPGGEDRG